MTRRPPTGRSCHSVPGFPIRYCKRAAVREAVLAAGRQPECIPGFGSSDLISGTYEGGFKVWESTEDILKWISDNTPLIRNKVILDLGCGAGLAGIACLLAGAAHVTFHDFNESVIEFFTKANVRLNMCSTGDSDQLPDQTAFSAGDWSEFHPHVRYDVILTSETIYDEKSYPKLLALIKRSLKADGTGIIAAKTCYFGVGGGTRSFEQFVNEDKSLRVESVRLISAPVQREILQLRFT